MGVFFLSSIKISDVVKLCMSGMFVQHTSTEKTK